MNKKVTILIDVESFKESHFELFESYFVYFFSTNKVSHCNLEFDFIGNPHYQIKEEFKKLPHSTCSIVSESKDSYTIGFVNETLNRYTALNSRYTISYTMSSSFFNNIINLFSCIKGIENGLQHQKKYNEYRDNRNKKLSKHK